jgi:LysR family transcriptional regulator, low CO2-responsive transcriptional regulator
VPSTPDEAIASLTLAQLQSFVTVARLGSVKAAAVALGVSEPAVSDAVGVLRRELGDELYIRAGGAIELTAGGERLAAAAGEILGLAEQARRAVREARGETAVLRVAATAAVAEYAAGPLLDAFTRRNPGIEVSLQVARGPDFAGLLAHRLADVALGSRPGRDVGAGIEAVPFLRITLVVLAGPRHVLARRRDIAPSAIAGETWLVGPSGAEPWTATGAFLAASGLAPREVLAFPSFGAARAQVAAGRGLTLAIAHTVLDEVERGALVALDVRGTPIKRLWFASMLAPDRRTAPAWALRRFVTTAEATQALLARAGGVPAERFRPPVHVTIWS